MIIVDSHEFSCELVEEAVRAREDDVAGLKGRGELGAGYWFFEGEGVAVGWGGGREEFDECLDHEYK